MAQVAYNQGVQSALPDQSSPDDYQRVDAGPDKFGAAIGEGAQQLGQGVSKVGQMFGEVQTDDAINNAMSAANKSLDNFRSLRGADALNAQESTQSEINDAFRSGRDSLVTLDQQRQYDQTVRPFQQRYVDGIIRTHADQQAKDFATQTNKNSLEVALTNVANVADDQDHVDMFREDARAAAIKQVMLDGYGTDPNALQSAVTRADQAVYKTQIETVAVKDPARAMQLVEQHRDTLGALYAPLANQLRARKQEQVGITAGTDAYSAATGGASSPIAPSTASATGSGPNPNNLGNVKTVYGAQTGAPDFVQPATPTDGVILAANNLRSGYQGLTLQQIGQKWEGTGNYQTWVDNVSKATGIAPTATPNLNDPAVVSTMLGGIAVAEKSQGDRANFTPDVIQAGVNAAFGGQKPQTGTPTVRANAIQAIMGRSDLDPEEKQHAISFINQQYQNQTIAAAADKQAKEQANDQAANSYVTRMLKRDYTGLSDSIANDPNLTWETKRSLGEAAMRHADDALADGTANYGPGFWSAFRGISAPPGDPNRVMDQQQLLSRAGPGGDLTLSGYEKLSAALDKRNKPDGVAENKIQEGAMKYAKHLLSFEADYGTYKVPDPKGEDQFNIGFIPAFYKYWNDGIASGKTPQELADSKQIDALAAPFKRTAAQLTADMLKADAGSGQAGAKPVIPQTPKGVPPGSQYSPSRQMWRDPSGKLYSADGQPQ